ncbi:MAG: hypothetical protein GYA51_07935 [Candidatus Methanofastidiosa archaeon]|nr:hypothetical protein [Candidatus Methanofastidiosa archaeon]
MKEYYNFFEFFNNSDCFVFRGINLSKYYYDYYVSKSLKSDTKARYLKNCDRKINPISLFYSITKLIYITLQKRKRILFFGASNRISKIKNRNFDFYNYRVIKDIGINNVIIIQDKREKIQNKIFSANLYKSDFVILIKLIEIIISIIHYNEIKCFCKNIDNSSTSTPISKKECKIRLLKFYSEYIFFNKLIKLISPRKAILICHYSKEPFIASCKHYGIKVIEFMHGQILPEHPYYNNRNISEEFSRAFKHLIPDYIGVYGNYWKESLINGKIFKESTIINIGYYIKAPLYKSKNNYTKRKLIVISSSPQVQDEIISYLKYLQKRLNNEEWKIIIKPHPSEDFSKYYEIIDNKFLYLRMIDIYKLLSKCDIHIGTLSTVIFEAIRFNVKNYVLFIDRYKHYCEYIVSSGVAEKLDFFDIPKLNNNFQVDRIKFFDNYKYEKIRKLLD